MLHFKAKMYQIQFRLELRPRPRWGSLRSPYPYHPYAIYYGYRLETGTAAEYWH